MQNIYLDWDELKIIVAKGFRIDFKETKRGYELFVLDRDITFTTNITISSEITDFEDNFKADANAFVLEDINVNSGDVNVTLEAENTDIATEPTLQEVRDTIGQESGQTVLIKLDQIDDTLNNLDLTVPAVDPFPGFSVRRFATNDSSPDLNVDGSITPVEFLVEPTTGKIFYVHSISIVLEDPAINFSKFGGISALTNGVDFKASQIGLSEVLLENIKSNGEIYLFANEIIFDSASTDILVAHINVKEDTGTTVKLVDSLSDNLKIIVNDNLTSIAKFKVIARGYEVNE